MSECISRIRLRLNKKQLHFVLIFCRSPLDVNSFPYFFVVVVVVFISVCCLNCSFILSKTSSWGYLKNGKFDGMIGALVRKQADIGGSPIFFRIERAKVIDYTTRTWIAR